MKSFLRVWRMKFPISAAARGAGASVVTCGEGEGGRGAMFMSGMTHASRPARPVSSCRRRRAQSGARTAELPVSELAPIRSDFLPARRRSAVLARLLAMALCLSVCLSVIVASRYSVETAERI